LQTLKLGASGYLTKQEAADELLTAIEKCLAGERYLSSSFSSLLISQVLQHCKAEELPIHGYLEEKWKYSGCLPGDIC